MRSSVIPLTFLSFLLLQFHPLAAQQWELFHSTIPATAFAYQGETVWVGTEGGLVRLTPGEPAFYYTALNAPLPSLKVNALAAQGADSLWVATTKGLALLHQENWTVFDTTNSPLRHPNVRSIDLDAESALWIANDFGGVARWKNGDWALYPPDTPGLTNRSSLILATVNHGVWVDNGDGISVFQDGEWGMLTTDDVLPGPINRMAEAPNGDIWMGASVSASNEVGLIHYDGSNWTVYSDGDPDVGLIDNAIESLHVDVGGTVWTSHRFSITAFDGEQWTTYGAITSGLPESDVEVIASGPDGKLWLSTFDDVVTFDGSEWEYPATNPFALPHQSANRLSIAPDGTSWFVFENLLGTDRGGLAKKNGDDWQLYTVGNSGLNSHLIRGIAASNEKVWLANSGMNRVQSFDGQNWETFELSSLVDDIPTNGISRDIAFTPQGNVWFAYAYISLGGRSGLLRYDSNEWEGFFPFNSSMPEVRVNNLAPQGEDTLWIATIGEGIVRKVGEEWTTFFEGACVHQVEIDASGQVWALLCDDGLYVWDGASWQIPQIETGGLPLDTLERLSATPNGLWAAYDEGLAYIQEGRLYNFPFAESPFGDLVIRNMEADAQGRLWLATASGLVAVRYDIPSAVAEGTLPVDAMQVFPNPNAGRFTLELHAQQAFTGHIAIFNSLGQVVLSRRLDVQPGRQEMALSLPGAAAGLYHLMVASTKGVRVMKFVVE